MHFACRRRSRLQSAQKRDRGVPQNTKGLKTVSPQKKNPSPLTPCGAQGRWGLAAPFGTCARGREVSSGSLGLQRGSSEPLGPARRSMGGEHGGGSHSGGGGGGHGMRRRPIDTQRKLPLIRSQKELALDDDTAVVGEVRAAWVAHSLLTALRAMQLALGVGSPPTRGSLRVATPCALWSWPGAWL